MFIPELKSQSNEDICILIKLDNHTGNYICECGDASKLTVKECQNTNAIFISHTHIDHFVNFDFILRHQIGIGRKVVVCGPKGITQQVQAKIKGYTWNLIEEGAIIYEIREIIDETTIQKSQLVPPLWEIEPLETQTSQISQLTNQDSSYPMIGSNPIFEDTRFKVHFTILDHKTPSIAYLFQEEDSVNIDIAESGFRGGIWVRELKTAFEENDKSKSITIDDKTYQAKDLFHLLKVKKGDSLGVVMDHAVDKSNHQKIEHLFKDCNKVFIESFYKEADKDFAKSNFHSYSLESAKIMRKCGVKEAIPVHFSRKYSEQEVAELIEEFDGIFSKNTIPS